MSPEIGGSYLEGESLEHAAQWLVDHGLDIPSSSAEIAEIIDDRFDGGLHWFIASQFASAGDQSETQQQR